MLAKPAAAARRSARWKGQQPLGGHHGLGCGFALIGQIALVKRDQQHPDQDSHNGEAEHGKGQALALALLSGLPLGLGGSLLGLFLAQAFALEPGLHRFFLDSVRHSTIG